MAEDDPGQGQAEPQRSAGRFDDGGAGPQLAAGPGLTHHVQGGPVLDAAGIEALEFRPETADPRFGSHRKLNQWRISDGEGKHGISERGNLVRARENNLL